VASGDFSHPSEPWFACGRALQWCAAQVCQARYANAHDVVCARGRAAAPGLGSRESALDKVELAHQPADRFIRDLPRPA
jgi:hypothetical protein